jgi:hypothetical protein
MIVYLTLNNKEAIKYFNKAINLNSDDIQLYCYKGDTLCLLGRYH